MADPQTIGRYQILGRIGRGGMGVVYLARDPQLDRQVAVKVLREFGHNEEFHERFNREARATARLQHRNIVTIFEFGEEQGQPFIAMEYLPGRTLAELIQRRDATPLERRLAIMLDVCAGLGYAHQQGLVHRDVKPANVMLVDDGTVKLLDFGTALLGASSLTQAGVVIGSIGYMSPEMAAGHTVDWRADVFAVGTILYELLTWQRPFEGGSFAVSLARVIRDDPAPPSLVVPGLPPELDLIVERCLRKNPDERYQNLEALAADIIRFRDSQTPATLARDVRPSPSVAAVGPVPKPISPPVPERPAPDPPPTAVMLVTDTGLTARPPGLPTSDGTVIISPEPLRAAEDDAIVRLLVGQSPDPHLAGQTLTIPHTGVTLGRDDDCDIVVKDPNWSRRHAAIHCENGSFVIADLGSANGTFVNGRRVQRNTPEPLFFGATIAIGETTLTFSYGRDTSLPDLSGVVIAQRYELERLLRESPKAALYAARDRNLPRDVAMKLLSPELARYTGYREQFEREARTAAQLQHPHICQVLDSGLTKIITASGRRLETHFLCFELMAGGSLAARLKRDEPLALHDIHRWSEMLGSALHYAHEQGVVHGDLKPSAIVFDAAGNLYLTDFSIAQRALVEGRRAVGAPAFMAPEQWDGATPTAAADQFAFAALVYLMLAGSRPFEGQDNPDIRQKNFRRGPIPVHVEAKQNGRSDIGRAASEVLSRALSVDPAHRFASVQQFSRALLKALGPGRAAGAEPMVFISYDRELSGGWARFFADRLSHSHGIKVFMDTAGLDRAGRFPPRLRRAIEDCDVFICFLAERSLESKWVSEEIRLAHQFSKTMIPIFQESYVEPAASDDESPVGTLIAHQGVKLFDISGHFVEYAVTDLAKLVKGALSGDPDLI